MMIAHNERIIVEACHVKMELWELAEARAAYGLNPVEAHDWQAREDLAQLLLAGTRDWSKSALDEWLADHERPKPKYKRHPRLPKRTKKAKRKTDTRKEAAVAEAEEAEKLGLLDQVVLPPPEP